MKIQTGVARAQSARGPHLTSQESRSTDVLPRPARLAARTNHDGVTSWCT
jgi:hypothetical protein